MQTPNWSGLTTDDLTAIRQYIARRTGLGGEALQDAVADGLLALVERGGVPDLGSAKYFAYIGAIDAHRRRDGRGTNPTRTAIRRADPWPETEVTGHGDRYPSDAEDLHRIIAWARTKPVRTRVLVWLILQGYTTEAAGAIVGVSPSRASQLLHGKGPRKAQGNVPPPS